MREDSRIARLCLAVAAAALTGGGIAAPDPDDALWEGVSYYSSFDTTANGIAAERGEGAFNTTAGGGSPAFIRVVGASQALDLATYNGWNSGNQTVLAAEDEAFTLVFRAKTGSTANGILFAFGTTSTGGLAFRRDSAEDNADAAGTLAVTTGTNSERIVYAPPANNGNLNGAYNTFALTYDAEAEAPLTLWVLRDGTMAAVGTGTVEGALISGNFQWRSRHGGNCSGEAHGNGALDALGIWKRVLSEEELIQVATAMIPAPVAVAFDDVPEGWGEAPKQAIPVLADRPVNLERDPAARQTLGDRAANVAVVEGSADAFDIHGIDGPDYGDGSTLERDVWLKVTGGTHGDVIGGKDNHWENRHANAINGNLLTELAGTAVADNAVGGLMGCSTGGIDGFTDGLPLTGDTLLTIAEGARVRGNIVGGDVVCHGRGFTHTGNATVRIRALQDISDASVKLNDHLSGLHVVGGLAGGDKANRGDDVYTVTLTGSSAVEVVLPDDADGVFDKEIMGGSYNSRDNGANYTYVTEGDASVVIDAPAAVTFPRMVCAGSRGPNATVRGAATLTLRGGTFACALTPSHDGATAEGGSALILAGGERLIDLSQATLGAFDTLTLDGGLVDLGQKRLTDRALDVRSGTIRLELMADEARAHRAALFPAEAVPEGLTVVAKDVTATPTLEVADGMLCAVWPETMDKVWVTPEGDSHTWADGLPGFLEGDNVAFGPNQGPEPVELPDAVRASVVTVSGDYVFSGAGTLAAQGVGVEQGGTLTLGGGGTFRSRWLRLRLSKRVEPGEGSANSDGWALAEIALTLDGERQPWPEGTTILASQAATNNAHSDDNLLDGDLGTKWLWSTDTTALDDDTCVITLDAGAGNLFVFDGYELAMADQNGRNPIAWSLQASADGETFADIDTRAYTQEEGSAWEPNAWLGAGPLAPQAADGAVLLVVREGLDVSGTLAGAGLIVGDVRFAEGAALRVGADGGPTVTGAVSGVPTLRLEDGVTLDGSTALRLLTAPEGLTFADVPEGYAVRHVDGAYILAPDFAAPFAVTLSGTVGWAEADWRDAAGLAIAPGQWPFLTDALSVASVTADGEATLTTDPAIPWVGTFRVEVSEGTLTLAGETPLAVRDLLDVQGTLAADPATLPLSARVVLGGTLVYDVPANGSITLPDMEGEGVFAKTGAGTLRLPADVSVAPTLHVRGGTLTLTSSSAYGDIPDLIAEGGTLISFPEAFASITDAEATITLRNNATFRFTNGNTWGARPIAPTFLIANDGDTANAAHIQGSYYGTYATFTGAIAGHGLLVFDAGQGNAYTLACPIADDAEGTLALRFADANNAINVNGAATHTGGTAIASAIVVGHAEALGRGPVSVEAGGKLTVGADVTLNVRGAYANAGAVSGAIRLCAGASLTEGSAVFDALAVEDGAAIPVALASGDDPTGRRLVQWAEGEGPAAAAAFAVEGWEVEARADGLYVVGPAETGPTLPESASGDESGDTFTPAAKVLLAAAAERAGLAKVSEVSGLANGAPMTTAQINEALACLSGDGLVVAEGSALRVAYDLTVTALAVSDGAFSVTAEVSAPGGDVVIAAGASVTAEPVSLEDGGSAGEPLASAVSDGSATVTLTGQAAPGVTLFRVRVRAPAEP